MPPPRSIDWPSLLITSGLATVLTAGGSIVVEYAKETHDTCDIVARFLEDESPSPLIDEPGRARLARAAVAKFERCVKD